MIPRHAFHVCYLLLLLCLQKAVSQSLTVLDLRCEAKRSPVGITSAHPAFSWKLAATGNNVMQNSYRILVATSPRLLNTQPDLWDSGKIPSAQSAFIPYGGNPLQSAATCYWKVETGSNEGHAVSAVDSFTTGIFRQQEWAAARWIGYEALPDDMIVYPGVHGSGNKLGNKALKRSIVPYLRKPFNIQKTVRQALVFVSGLGQYELYLNGQRVGNDFLAPGWTNYTKTCLYNTFDVTSQLRQQQNVIGAVVGNGFLNINRERYRKLVTALGYPMLRLKLLIRYTDGTENEIVTDDSWKTAPSPVVFSSIYGGEDYDANLEQPGWCNAGFNDRGWRQAVIVNGPGGEMLAQMAYPMQVMDSFAVRTISMPQPGKYVVDFGQNASGIIRLKVTGIKGSRVRITPAELLDDNGLPYQKASGSPYYFSYTLKGDGTEEWTPCFTYYGFRYAMIEGAVPSDSFRTGDSARLQELRFLHTRNSAPAIGYFECSDTLLNRIYTLISWAIRSNLANVATDCPHREKLGWLEQTYLLRSCVGYNYDILHLYNKTVDDMMAAQLPDGLVPDIAPEYVAFDGGFRDSPEWGSAAIQIPWFLYTWYGDKQVLERAYGMMQRYLDYLARRSRNNILDYGLGDWFDMGPGRPGYAQLTPVSLTATAIYFQDADVMAKVAHVLGKTEDAERYKGLAGAIARSFNSKFFNTSTGVYSTGSQTAYAMPLYTGLVDEQYRAKVLSNLTDSIRSNNYKLTAGDIGYHYLVNILSNNDQSQLLYDMNNRDDVPGYAFQLKHGATALTESWPALRFVSNNHMMLGHLMEWFFNGLAGIRQADGDIGFSTLEIAPQLVDGVDWVKAGFETAYGAVQVDWRKNGKQVSLNITLPPNTKARVILPGSGKSLDVGSGTHHFMAQL